MIKLARSYFRLTFFVGLAFTQTHCSSGSFSSDTPAAAQSTAPPTPSLSLSPATAAECTAGAGGMDYVLYVDQNSNGLLDTVEPILSSQAICNGANGATGATGANGSNGLSLVFESVPAPASVCAAGGYTLLIALDKHGTGVYAADDLYPQSLTVCNGAAAPPTAYTPVAVLQPCGATVAEKEVLLRLANGQVLASFSDTVSGSNTRLSFIPDGTFVDTDDSACTFTLVTAGDGQTRSVSWQGKVQMTWPMVPSPP